MEEAEALCQRIGIMAQGTLRCCAEPTRLKQLYGRGFKVFFNTAAGAVDNVSAFVEKLLPRPFRKIDSYTTNISYEFAANGADLPCLIAEITKNKNQVGILDWGLSQTTLDEVFLNLIHEYEACM
jgi:ABC-type multidrug transport system ATPase subunit